MARDWRIAPARLSCGAVAGCSIPAGAQYCLLRGEGWIVPKLRCRQHAGSEPPEVIDGPASGAPAAVDERSTERATAESTGTYLPKVVVPSFTRVGAIPVPVDWARRAAGEKDED
jgi:hypothetical protein